MRKLIYAVACASLLLLTSGCATEKPSNQTDPPITAQQEDGDDAAVSSERAQPRQGRAALREDRLSLYERPVDLPLLEPGEDCPRSEVGDAVEAVAQTYGHGPVYATLGSWDGTISFAKIGDPGPGGWYYAKVLWSIQASYGEAVIVRGRQLDGGGAVLFSPDEYEPSGRHLTALAFPPRTAARTRHVPSAVLLYQTGCYAFQVDGPDFTDTIVFQVVD